ncbi:MULTISPECIES: hypothetical protein [unclassified Microcoleus]|uniref:hypothetical protein n=1 Tax=unclassified Microcoleus TaxID=2642155 RepID=UPI002FD462F3
MPTDLILVESQGEKVVVLLDFQYPDDIWEELRTVGLLNIEKRNQEFPGKKLSASCWKKVC